MEDQDNSKPIGDMHNNHKIGDSTQKAELNDVTNDGKLPFTKKSMARDLLSDLEVQIIRMKHSLESWREIILPIHSVLLWEKNWHPGAIISGTTFLFLSLWLLDPSVLTTVSILGLTVTISDYVVPMLTAAIFKQEAWTAAKDTTLYNFCRGIVVYRAKVEVSCAAFYVMRTSKPKMYYGSTILTLAFLAWIGNSFNNLFLTYLLVTILLLMPGMEYHGILHKYGSTLSHKLSECAKLKIAQPKKEQ